MQPDQQMDVVGDAADGALRRLRSLFWSAAKVESYWVQFQSDVAPSASVTASSVWSAAAFRRFVTARPDAPKTE